MAKKAYQTKEDKQTDWGYFTVGPFPKRSTADLSASNFERLYAEVLVEETPSGYVVKYRGPRK